MKALIEVAILVPLFIFLFQFYSYVVTSTGIEKQKKCQVLGIIYTTIGICCLTFHSMTPVIGGLLLIMLGLRLIAHGLDRIDREKFIESYTEDEQ